MPDTSANTTAWGAYLNAWIYGETTGTGQSQVTRFPIWQQDHADSPFIDQQFDNGAPCPNGKSAKYNGRTYRFIANAASYDGSSTPVFSGLSSPSVVSNQHVYLGTATGNDAVGSPPLGDDSILYQISNDLRSPYLGIEFPAAIVSQGEYLSPSATVRGPDGVTSVQTGTSNGWQFHDNPVANDVSGSGLTQETESDRSTRLRIITGTEFSSPGAMSSTYSLGVSIAFQAVLDYSRCA